MWSCALLNETVNGVYRNSSSSKNETISCLDILLMLDTVTSVGAFPDCSFRPIMSPDSV